MIIRLALGFEPRFLFKIEPKFFWIETDFLLNPYVGGHNSPYIIDVLNYENEILKAVGLEKFYEFGTVPNNERVSY